MAKYKLSLFIFRNDLRLSDNTALINALENSDKVIPVFIFNKKQISTENEYRSLNSMQFLKNSLIDLNNQLKLHNSQLYLFYDKIDTVINQLKKEYNLEAVYFNKDYTPFARKRDKQIKQFCDKNQIKIHTFHDKLLIHPKQSVKENGEPYSVYSPFFKKNSLIEVNYPIKNNPKNYFTKPIKNTIGEFPYEFNECNNPSLIVNGGRSEAQDIMRTHVINLDNYKEVRDIPNLKGTTHLSAHLKFGTISPRELYYFVKENLNENNPIINQLYWRDFWNSIAYFHPRVFGEEYQIKYEKINWNYNKEQFEKWKHGETGFPIVDAGMRELNKTGYMHNRVRMIVASFLTKDLQIDWRWGEKYFTQKLTDYDPCLNNGNWQWAASTGCDGQPYFRVFSPVRQSERFDSECNYIKKWIPELKDFTVKQIHNYPDNPIDVNNYSKPMVDHKTQSKIAISMFKEIKG